MRLGSGVLFRERPKIPKPRSHKNRRNRQLCRLRTARGHRLYNALELSTVAMHQVRSSVADGWQHDRLQTLQHNATVRTRPPQHLRINRPHPRMLQHHPRKRPSSQQPDRIRHCRHLLTGSVNAGRTVAQAASTQLKKFVLELGGSDPFLVLEDADIEAASTGAVAGRFINNGQSCIATKRIIVVKHVLDEFLDKFVKKTKSLRVGDPLSPETDIGPMVREEALKTLDGQVKDALKQGANLEHGGERLRRKGSFYAPTILTNVTPEMRIMKEETFGPAAPVIVVKDENEAIRLANRSEFGLGATVWGVDTRRAEKVAREVSAGLVTVNNVVVSDPRMPFGGVRHSGIGRELSRYGMLEFTNIKSVRVYEKSPLAHAHV